MSRSEDTYMCFRCEHSETCTIACDNLKNACCRDCGRSTKDNECEWGIKKPRDVRNCSTTRRWFTPMKKGGA